MRRKCIGEVLLVSGLLIVVLSTVVLEVFQCEALVSHTPDYQGPFRFRVYSLALVYVLGLGSVLSIMGLVGISYPKNRVLFLFAVLIINAPLLYFLWIGHLPDVLFM